MFKTGSVRPSGDIVLVISEEFAHYIRLLIHFLSGDPERSAYQYFRDLDRFLEMEDIPLADPKDIRVEGEITFFNFEGLNPEAAVGTQIPLVHPGDSQMEYVATKLEGDWWAIQDEEDGTPRPELYSTKEIFKYFKVRTPTKERDDYWEVD